jgi:hypothetical protein
MRFKERDNHWSMPNTPNVVVRNALDATQTLQCNAHGTRKYESTVGEVGSW